MKIALRGSKQRLLTDGQYVGTSKCFQLLHMDLMGPVEVDSFSGKRYAYVVVDDFSRYTWINFLKEKSETFGVLKTLHVSILNLYGTSVLRIRSDHGTEFENKSFADYCDVHGIFHEYSAPKTPKQNGIDERKDRTLKEMARVMINSMNV